MNVHLNRQISHAGKIFVFAEGLGFEGFVPSPIQPKEVKPFMDWTGGRIPMTLWQTILAFFKKHADNEVQVRLYYNTVTREWQAHAFPQEYPSGMTTRELPGHANTAVDANLFPEPWIRLGSVHHHCSASAFQSGTDKADEETVCGLHITVGKLKDPTWDLHSRVCIRIPGKLDDAGKLIYGPQQCFYDADLTTWFCLPNTWTEILPTPVQNIALKHMLSQPPDNTIAFPARWEENLVRRDLPNGNHHRGYDPREHTGNSHNYNSSPPAGRSLAEDWKNGRSAETGNGVTARKWETITPQVLEVIIQLIEIYNDANGRFIAQVVETNRFRDAGFSNILAVEQVLQTCGLVQASRYVWCFPQDKKAVEGALRDMAEMEARDELKQAHDDAMAQAAQGETQ